MQNEFEPEVYEEIHLSDYWRILKRHKVTVITVFLATVLTVTVHTIMMTPIYRATAVLFIDQEGSNNVVTITGNDLALGSQSYSSYKEYFQSQKEIIRGRSLVEQVFDEFALVKSADYAVDRSPGAASAWSGRIKQFITDLLGREEQDEAAPVEQYPDKTDPVNKFLDTISVEEVRNTRLLKLHVENKDPVLATEIANRLAQLYVERNLVYISKSEILNLHKNEYLMLQDQLSEFSKIYKDQHPKIIRLKEKIAEVTQKIKQERAETLPGNVPQISVTDLAGLKANNVSVQDYAKPVFKPVKPQKRKNIMLAIIVGLFGGVGLAFFLEYLDNTVKSVEDIQRVSEWPFLGYIPIHRRKRKQLDLWMHTNPKSALSETFRTVRTSLLFSSTEEHPLRTILLTSPGQKEGKSTTVCNLAIALAQNEKKVLLVDADMRKPRLHRVFGAGNIKGLSTFLSNQAPFEDVVQNTEIENLFFTGCGPHPPNPSELLASRKMSEFLDHAKGRYDYILLDTPPVMMVTDAVILSKVVDGTILVFESGKTSRKVVPMLQQIVKNARCRVVGFLINKIKAQGGDYNYYYKYYSRYYGVEDGRKSG